MACAGSAPKRFPTFKSQTETAFVPDASSRSFADAYGRMGVQIAVGRMSFTPCNGCGVCMVYGACRVVFQPENAKPYLDQRNCTH